ncbi:MAG: ABC transporter ATP-binding protein [Eubacteriales bacterium]|nr:ABC transporter ATP-binding protein [Eubacteriales bacterium]
MMINHNEQDKENAPSKVRQNAPGKVRAPKVPPVETITGDKQVSRFCPGLPPEELVVQVRELYKIYRVGDSRVHALDGVDFDVRRGEFCTIVGTSGSGKSTLLNMLAGLEAPSHGLVRLQGQNIVGKSEQELVAFRRENVGFIFQSFNLIQSMNALENVALPLVFRGEPRQLREQKAAITLHMMGLGKQIYRRPSKMSGGQQQRVGIARALVVHPKIIFADEPTGNLDSHTSQEIMDLIQSLSKKHGQTFIMVTHDNNLAEYGDRIFRILDGKIVSVERGEKRYELRKQESDQSAKTEQ